MTIDIIAAAQADRWTKLENIAIAEEQAKRLSDEALRLRLDVIAIDQFIARARGYADGGGTDQPEAAVESAGPSEAPAVGGGAIAAVNVQDGLADTVGVEPSPPTRQPQPSSPAAQEEPVPPQAGSFDSDDALTDAERATLKGEPLIRDRVRLCRAMRPAWSSAQVAAAAECKIGSTRAYFSLDPAPAAIEEPAPPSAPVEAPEEEDEDEPIPAPAKRVAARPPAGTKFRLIDRKSGRWLHQSLQVVGGSLAITAMREHAWCGTERQMAKVRAQHPETVDMKEEVVM